MTYNDGRILHQIGTLAVQAHTHRVHWRNGSFVVLHPVQNHGVRDPYLRGWEHSPGAWVLIDLRRIAGPTLETDIKALPQSDAEGVAFYALRLNVSGAHDFRELALAQSLCTWRAAAEPALVTRTATTPPEATV